MLSTSCLSQISWAGEWLLLIFPLLRWGQTSAGPVFVGQSCCDLSPNLQKSARKWILERSFLLLLLEEMSISWGFQSCAWQQSFQTWPVLGLFAWVMFGSRIPRDEQALDWLQQIREISCEGWEFAGLSSPTTKKTQCLVNLSFNLRCCDKTELIPG